MGWYTLPIDGESILWHSGDDANFHADMVLLPQSQWAVVVLRNANSELPDLTLPGLFSLPTGIIDLLLGQQPHAAELGLSTIFLIVDMTIFVILLLALWSTLKLLQKWQQPLKHPPVSLLWELGLPLLWEVVLPVGLFIAIPHLTGASWTVALLFLPDVSFWMLGMFLLLFITGIARSARIVGWSLKSRRKERPFLSA